MDNKINWQRPQTNYPNFLPEEKEKIEHAISRANSIRWAGIISIIIIVTLLFAFFITFFTSTTTTSFVIFAILILFNLIISIIFTIKIAKTDWVDSRLNKSKKSYWISSLVSTIFCLPAIPQSFWLKWSQIVRTTLKNRLKMIK